MGFIVALLRRHLDVLAVHKRSGQLSISDKSFRPAVKHSAMQAARAGVLGRWLGLSPAMVVKFEEAAFLHDSLKIEEVRAMKRYGKTWSIYAAINNFGHLVWLDAGIDLEVVEIAASVAHESLLKMVTLLEKEMLFPLSPLTEFELACLAMHWLDDWAIDDEWARPAQGSENMLHWRCQRNASNPTYQAINEAGRTKFAEEAQAAGRPDLFIQPMSTYDRQLSVGLGVQELLARVIRGRGLRVTSSLDLPVMVDNVLRQELQDRTDLLLARGA